MDAPLTAPTQSPSGTERVEFRPQPGPQTEFLRTRADIAIYGGAAGGGKSYALLLDVLRHIRNPRFAGVVFRRTYPRIAHPGGLADQSSEIYPYFGARGLGGGTYWGFPSGGTLKFSHLDHEKAVLAWGGSQLPFIGFDELTEFTEKQFFFFLSRNRSTSGIPGYIRATTNPIADSWVARFIEWWIDQEPTLRDGSPNPRFGLAIPERSGVLRWFIRRGDNFVWADSKDELGEDGKFAKSVTFIPARLTDNQILMQADPSYLASLMALGRVDRERLLEGNWKVMPAAGMFFRRSDFEIVDAVPALKTTIRFWDRAASEETAGGDPDWTCGVKMSRTRTGFWFVEDVVRMRARPFDVEKAMLNLAAQDGIEVTVGIYQDPGAAGVNEALDMVRKLAGYHVHVEVATTAKETRAKPVSSQCQHGNVKLLRGRWNDPFLVELENFPEGAHDDQVDPFASAFNFLTSASQTGFQKITTPEYNDRREISAGRGVLM